MSKKIFFIVLTCCLLVATFCVSFAGAPQVQHAPANVRAVLDRPDCLAAPLIVPPVVEPFSDFVSPRTDFEYLNTDIYSWTSLNGDWPDSPSFSSGLYKLIPSVGSSGEVGLDFSGKITLLGLQAGNIPLADTASSSVSPFTILYSSYTSFSYELSSTSMTVTLSTGFGQYTVEGDFSIIYFSVDSPFYVYSDSEDINFSEGNLNASYVVSPIFDTLVSGLRALGTNVGRAFSTMANAIFINADGTGLSIFAILVVCFAAVSLGLSLTRWVLNFCSSWGKRNR